MVNLGTLTAHLGVDTKGLKVAQLEMSRFTRNVQGGASSALASITRLGSLFVAGVVAVGIKRMAGVFANYETALVDMGKVTGESLKSIDKKIKGLDGSLGSSTQLMQGYYQTISAGVKEPKRALDLLTTAAKAGKAAHIEQAEVIKALTKMMAGFDGQLRNAAEASDLLFRIEKEGQTTFAELVPVVGGLALLSRELSVSADEMGGSLAAVTQTAGNTAEASTRLEGLFVALMKPTEELKRAYKDLGYETAQAMVKEKGWADSLRALTGWAEKAGIPLAQLFQRKEALLALASLAGQDFKVLGDNIKSMGDKAGGTDKAFEEYRATLHAVWDELKNNLGKAIIEFTTVFVPAMEDAIGGLSNAFKWMFGKLSLNKQFDEAKVELKKLGMWTRENFPRLKGGVWTDAEMQSVVEFYQLIADETERAKKNIQSMSSHSQQIKALSSRALDISTLSAHGSDTGSSVTVPIKAEIDKKSIADAIKAMNDEIKSQYIQGFGGEASPWESSGLLKGSEYALQMNTREKEMYAEQIEFMKGKVEIEVRYQDTLRSSLALQEAFNSGAVLNKETLQEMVDEGLIGWGEYTEGLGRINELTLENRTAFEEWADEVKAQTKDLSGMIVDVFEQVSSGIGYAFGQAIVYGENLGDALKDVFKSIAANAISAFIQIAIQNLIISFLGHKAKVAQQLSEVYLASFASIAAIPIIGPELAPAGAAAAVIAASTGAVGASTAGEAVAMATSGGMMGIAHGGLEVQKEGTYLLQKGELVLSPNQNTELMDAIRELRDTKRQPVSVHEHYHMRDIYAMDDRAFRKKVVEGVQKDIVQRGGTKRVIERYTS